MAANKLVKFTRDTPSDPSHIPGIDVTGRQGPAPRRRSRPVRPDAQRIEEIRRDAREQFELNPMVALCRSGTKQAAIDRAERRKQGRGEGGPSSVKRRWGAFLLQSGRARLTAAQKRNLRRRSTREELLALDLTPVQRRYLKVEL